MRRLYAPLDRGPNLPANAEGNSIIPQELTPQLQLEERSQEDSTRWHSNARNALWHLGACGFDFFLSLLRPSREHSTAISVPSWWSPIQPPALLTLDFMGHHPKFTQRISSLRCALLPTAPQHYWWAKDLLNRLLANCRFLMSPPYVEARKGPSWQVVSLRVQAL